MRLLAALALITLSLGCGRANPLVDDDIEGAHASLTKGTGGANNGDSDYCGYTVSTVCADGEGDCDGLKNGVSDCAAGLTCIPNQGASFGLGASVDLCLPLHCVNRLQDNGESGLDCGTDVGCKACPATTPTFGQTGAVNGSQGYCTSISPCPNASGDCNTNADCQSGLICVPNVGLKYGFSTRIDVCAPAHCTDRVNDSDELGVDCGGSCAPCTGVVQLTTSIAVGAHGYCTSSHQCGDLLGDCDHDTDCTTGLSCIANKGAAVGLPSNADICMPATCVDRVLDGDEFLADCGGSCPPCQGAKGSARASNGSPTYCSNAMNLCAAGEGNCTVDAQCSSGLVCIFQRGASFGLPAGTNICLLATCNDGSQDGDETAVDCGGSCGTCTTLSGLTGGATCTNGVRDGNETGIDCGGSCHACSMGTCTDGKQNGTETGVDCGGACLPCATCSDGVQNGSETGVDCGGSCPTACPTCSDGVQNGNETGVDCGGACQSCGCTPNVTEACYEGPTSTLNVGLCQGGTHTCSADGSTWSDCKGEVLPTGEDCSLGVDSNCDGIVASCNVSQVQAAETIGATGDQLVRAATVDPATGNVYAVGYFTTQIVFPGQSTPFATSAGGNDAFVAQFDPNGAFLNAVVLGDKYNQYALTVAFDTYYQRVLVGGYFTGSMVLPNGTTLTSPTAGNQQDAYVVALTPDLKQESGTSFSFGDPVKNQQAWSISVNQTTGEAYVGGYYRGLITLAGNSTMTGTDWHAFVAKFDSSGPIWVNGFGSQTATGQTYLRSIGVDVKNGVVIGVGYFNGTTSFTGVNVSTSALTDNDGYVFALDASTGVATYQAIYGGVGDQQVRRVVMDANGDSAVVGYFTNQFSGLGAPFTADATAAYDSFVSYYDDTAKTLIARQITGKDGQYLDAVSFGADGTIRVAGEYNTELAIDAQNFKNAGGRDGFFGAFKTDGTFIGGVGFGDASDQHTYAVASGSQNAAWVVGSLAGTSSLGQFNLTSAAGQDGFLVRANFGTDARVDLDGNAGQLPNGANWPVISGDGTWVAFVTDAQIDAVNDTNGTSDVYVRNRTTGDVFLASIGNDGTTTTGNVSAPTISDDGNIVGFATDAALDSTNDTNSAFDYYVFNRTTKQLRLVSLDGNGASLPDGIQVDGVNAIAGLSGDGNVVVFASRDAALDSVAFKGDNLYAFNLTSGTLSLVTKVAGRSFQDGNLPWPPAVNGDGSVVAFTTYSGDRNTWADGQWGSYVIDTAQGSYARIDLAADGYRPSGNSKEGVTGISADGVFVSFWADVDILKDDSNGQRDVYVYDRAARRTIWASKPLDGRTGGVNIDSPTRPSHQLSQNGRFVVFSSCADDFDALDVNGNCDVFVADTWKGTSSLMSSTPTASSGNDASQDGQISGDGQYVVFESVATNFTVVDSNSASDIFVGPQNFTATTPAVYATVTGLPIAETGGKAHVFVQLQTAPTADVTVAMHYSGSDLVLSNTSITFAAGTTELREAVVVAVNDDIGNGDRGAKLEAPTVTSADTHYNAINVRGTNAGRWDGTVTLRDSDDIVVETEQGYSRVSNVARAGVQDAALSADGRFSIFYSADNGIVAGDTNKLTDAFVRDHVKGTVQRINVYADGSEAKADCKFAGIGISADGRYAVFTSCDSLADGKDTLQPTVFLRDLKNGITTRVSEASDHSPADNQSLYPEISADGSTVLFTSWATNLVANDTNAAGDIFVYDVASATTSRVLAPSGTQPSDTTMSTGGLSADGTKFTFMTLAPEWTRLPVDDPGQFTPFYFDRTTNTPTPLFVDHGVVIASPSGTIDSGMFAISSDGAWVAFGTDANFDSLGDGNGLFDLYLLNPPTKSLLWLSRSWGGSKEAVTDIAVAAYGTYVGFETINGYAGDGNGTWDAYVVSTLGATGDGNPRRVSSAADTSELPDGAQNFVASAGLNFVMFSSSDDVPQQGNTKGGLFTRGTDVDQAVITSASMEGINVGQGSSNTFDVQLSTQPSDVVTITIVSKDPSRGTTSESTLTFTPDNWNIPQTVTVNGSASGSGSFDIILQTAGNDPAYSGQSWSVKVTVTNESRVSTDSSNGELSGGGRESSISSGGRYVAFIASDDIDPSDSNGLPDIYRKDRQTGALVLASPGHSGCAIESPQISSDGRYVGFLSCDRLADDDTNRTWDFYVFDTRTRSLELATRDADGKCIERGVNQMNAAMSADGSTVAFLTVSPIDKRVRGDSYNVFTRNWITGDVALASIVAGHGLVHDGDNWKSGRVVTNDDGSVVAFTTMVDDVDMWGSKAGVFVSDLANATVERIDIDKNGLRVADDEQVYVTGMSSDGRFVSFVTGAALDASDTNDQPDLYVRDRFTSRTVLASRNLEGSAGSVNFFEPGRTHGLSANGRFAVFSSDVDAFDPADSNGYIDVFVTDLWLGTTALASTTTDGSNGDAKSYYPSISPDGAFIAFTSDSDNFVNDDANRRSDVFVGKVNQAALQPAIHVAAQLAGIVEFGGRELAYIQLQTAPTADVTINVQSTDTNAGTLNVSSLTFTTANWAGTQALKISAVNDDANNGDRAFNVALGDAVSTDENYSGMKSDGISVRVLDSLDYTIESVEAYQTQIASKLDRAHAFALSADGHFSIFTSSDSLLVPSDQNGATDAFVRDRLTGAITRVNVSSSGLEGDKGIDQETINLGMPSVGISADGRYAVFTSVDTNLVDNDGAQMLKVFLHDLRAGTTIRISEAPDHSDPDSASYAPVISADGSTVAFVSNASNLVADEALKGLNIFLYDVASGVVSRLMSPGDVEPDGNAWVSSISADGTKLVFSSSGTTWTPSINPGLGAVQIYVADLTKRSVIMVSQAAGIAGISPVNRSVTDELITAGYGQASISSDGNFVAFASRATNLDPSDTNIFADVFLYDIAHDSLARLTQGGTDCNEGSWNPTVSANGASVSFLSDCQDLPGPVGGGQPVPFVWTSSNGMVNSLDQDASGSGLNGPFGRVAMSAQGNFVTFSAGEDVSRLGPSGIFTRGFLIAPALVVSKPDGVTVADSGTSTFTVQLTTQPAGDVTITLGSSDPSLGTASPATITFTAANWFIPQTVTVTGADSGAGSFTVTLTSSSTDDGYNSLSPVIVKGSLVSESRVDTDATFAEIPEGAKYSAISKNGLFVAFASTAKLDGRVRQDGFNTYLKNMSTGEVTLCSIGNHGEQAGFGDARWAAPQISADGRYVGFVTTLALDPDDTNGQFDFYVFDSQSKNLVLASRDGSGEALADGVVDWNSQLSSDGTAVAFRTVDALDKSAPSDGSSANIYVRNLNSGVVTLMSRVAGRGAIKLESTAHSGEVVTNADGSVVAFRGGNSGADLWGMRSGVYVATAADGVVERVDLDQYGATANDDMPFVLGMSADGRFVAFATLSALDSGDNNSARDVYVRDRATQTTIWASVPLAGHDGGVSPRENVSVQSMSANGRFVVFQSDADDFDLADTNGTSDVFVADLWNHTVKLASTTADGPSGIEGKSYWGNISPDGAFISFTSDAANFVTDDTNRAADVFVGSTNTAAHTAAAFAASTFNGPSWSGNTTNGIPEVGGQGFVYVQLGKAPTSDVTIAVSSGASRVASVSPATLTFTPENWAQTQVVTVAAVDDHAPNGDRGLDVFLDKCMSADAAYNGVGGGRFKFNVLDSLDLGADTNEPYVRASNSDPGYAGQSLSATGRYDVFVSTDRELVPGDTNSYYDVFLRDRLTGQIERESVSSTGAEDKDGAKYGGSASADGRYVVFTSAAHGLVANDHSAFSPQIFLRDRVLGTTTRVSEGPSHLDEDNASYNAFISADGSTVVFGSRATNLVANDKNGVEDIFVYDVATGVVSRLLAPGGVEPGAPSDPTGVSADGSKISFSSTAREWSGVEMNGEWQAHWFDRSTGSAVLISQVAGTAATGDCSESSISPDGEYVAFSTDAPNLDITDTNGFSDVYVYDILGATMTRITSAASCPRGSVRPKVSLYAQRVLFSSDCEDLPTSSGNDVMDAFMWVSAGNTVQRVSFDALGGDLMSNVNAVSMSSRGDVVAFSVNEDVMNDGSTKGGVFSRGFTVAPALIVSKPHGLTVQDGGNSTYTVQLSTQPTGDVTITVSSDNAALGTVSPTTITFTPSNWEIPQTVTITGAASGSGDFNTFLTSASSDSNYNSLEATGVKVQLVSSWRISTDGSWSEIKQGGTNPVVSSDGRYVVFITTDSLDIRDGNGTFDAYRKDRQTGEIKLVSTTEDALHAAGMVTSGISVSGDGRYVGFVTSTDLDSKDTNARADFYVFDALTGAVSLVDIDASSGTAPANGVDQSNTMISRDGATAVFKSNDDLLGTGAQWGVYRKNLRSGVTSVAASAAGLALSTGAEVNQVVVNADASVVAFIANRSTPPLWSFTSMGVYAMDERTNQLERLDVTTGGYAPPSLGGAQIMGISDDGRFVAFATGLSLDPTDTNGSWDLYVRDRLAQQTIWASKPLEGHRGGVRADDMFTHQGLSANGRFVLFTGPADDFDAADKNGSPDVFVTDLWLRTTKLASATAVAANGNSSSQHGAISGDGQTIAFDSNASNFVADDGNGVMDVFVGTPNAAAVTPAIYAVASANALPEFGGQGSVFVQMQTAPTANVTVNVATDNAANGAVSAATVTFTRGNWAQTHTVGVSAVNDDAPNGDRTFNVITSAAVSADPAYNGLAGNKLNFHVRDSNDIVVDTQDGYTIATRQALGAKYNAGSYALSATGRYSIFYSGDPFLVPGDLNNVSDVFVRDHVTGAITRVNVTTSGYQSGVDVAGLGAGISGDGRYAVFASRDALEVDSRERGIGVSNIYLRDLQNNVTTLVSTRYREDAANASSIMPTISADGSTVLFTSQASNLVANDTNGAWDMFTYNTQSGALTRVLMPNGRQFDGNSFGSGGISADGTKIAFASTSKSLAAGSNGNNAAYYYDLSQGVVRLLSQSSGKAVRETRTNLSYYNINISGDGASVVFATDALFPSLGKTTGTTDVFLYDVGEGSLSWITSGIGEDLTYATPMVSNGGKYVSFISNRDISPNDKNGGYPDAYVYSAQDGTYAFVSTDVTGASLGGGAPTAAISADANFVAYATAADAMKNGGKGGIFTHGFAVKPGLLTSTTSTISLVNGGTTSFTVQLTTQPSGNVTVTVHSSDSSLATVSPATITFTQANWNIPQTVGVTGSASGVGAFTVTMSTSSSDTGYAAATASVAGSLGSGRRISTDSSGAQLGYGGYYVALSNKAQYAAMALYDDVLGNDLNGTMDVYLKNLTTGALTLASIGNDGTQSHSGDFITPQISSDGRYVGFATQDALDPLDKNSSYDFYIYDTGTASLSLASLTADGKNLPTGIFQYNAAMSADGATLAFITKDHVGPAVEGGGYYVYVRDLTTGAVTLVSKAEAQGIAVTTDALVGQFGNDGTNQVAINADGSVVAFCVVEPRGLFGTKWGIFVADLGTGTLEQVDLDDNGHSVDVHGAPDQYIHGISADGRFVSYYTSEAYNVSDTNNAPDVYMRDRTTQHTAWVSRPPSGYLQGASGGGDGNLQGMSDDGRFLVFTDVATVQPGHTKAMDVFMYDAWTDSTSLASTTTGAHGNNGSYGGALSPDGEFVGFASYATNLVPGDTNGNQDLFLGTPNGLAVRPAIRAVASSLALEEMGGKGTVAVQLQTQPTSNVTVAISSSNTGAGTVSPATLTFTRGNWARAQYVTVTAVDDHAANGDRTFNVNVGAASSSDTTYSGLGSTTLNFAVIDSTDVTVDTIERYTGRSVMAFTGLPYALSADGRYDLFASGDSGLTVGDTNNGYDLFLRDRVNGTTTNVVVDRLGRHVGAAAFEKPAATVSADGRYVAFMLDCDALVCGDGTAGAYPEIFVRDMLLGTTIRISEGPGHADPDEGSLYPYISADGSTVVFHSNASNLVANDTNGVEDIFVYSMGSGSLTRLMLPGGGQPTTWSEATGISDDGSRIVFTSSGNDWAGVACGFRAQVFVADRNAGTVTMVSQAGGVSADDQVVGWPRISGDGGYVAFVSDATNLDLMSPPSGDYFDVYLADLGGGTLARLTHTSSGPRAAGASDVYIARNATRVAFLGSNTGISGDPMDSTSQLFLWSAGSGSTVRVSYDVNGGELPDGVQSAAISADGAYVSFMTSDDVMANNTGGGIFTFGL